MTNTDEHFCVFFAGQNPAESEPVATFDRMQFMEDFFTYFQRVKNQYSKFREQDRANSILTVSQWRELRGI